MNKTNIFRYLVNFYITFFILSPLKPGIFPQSIDKTTNWPEPVFEHLTIADGLPENSVRCILQDHLGYMWFGTQNGLVKYDGYTMKVYQPDPDDSLSISDRQIFSIYEDKSGTLWVGTEHEDLNRFDRATETFTRYTLNLDDSTQENEIKIIYEDNSEGLLVGNGNKLIVFDPQSKSSKDIYTQDSIIARDARAIVEDTLADKIFVAVKNRIMIYDPENKVLLKDNKIDSNLELGRINSFFQAANGTIWIGHSKGLAKFNSLQNTIEYFQPNKSDKDSSDNYIFYLIKDKNGLIWGTNGFLDSETATGLICFDPKQEQFKRFEHDEKNDRSLSNNALWSLYKDNSGAIWIGSWGGELNKWSRSQDKFKRFSYDTHGRRFNHVYNILEDKLGIIWIDTDSNFYSFNRLSNEFQNHRYDTKYNKTIGWLYVDESGNICCNTNTRGLGKFNREKGLFNFYSSHLIDSLSFKPTCFLSIDSNNLWVGTWGYGLYWLDKKTGNFTRFMHDSKNPKSLSGNFVLCIYNDKRGDLWIGTNNGGLNLFNRTDKSFKTFISDLGEGGNSTIPAIYEDNKGNFWVGTYLTGLYLFDRNRGKPVYNITVKDGLPSNVIHSILEDDSGNLWIGTQYGLSKFDPETHRIRNYYTSDVFDENKYFRGSACKTSTGEMLFGSFDGFIMFHPDNIKDDPVTPQVVISNVSLLNRPGEKLKFNGFISEMKELDLSYNENDLRFDYVGLHYADPSKNRYKYKLEGYDKDWVDAGTQRNATYTNLSAGEYVFKVTACNEDDVWNKEGASIKIKIPPPFWATLWAYSLYILFGLVLLYSIRRYELNRSNLKNQVKLDAVKLKEREEMDKMKSRFFANISHEFRTPLTLISGPIDKILSKHSDEETVKQGSVIKKSANRLLGLINQLLDLSKLEAGKLELKASNSNIVSFIKGITMSFESAAERKDITLKVKAEKEEIELYFDKEKMTKIMANLLSNAFKFTPEGGEITVSLSLIPSPSGRGMSKGQGEGSVQITVFDTGIGISEEELPKLFDRFYQVDSSQTREHEGTGIGLALTKELVELHHGTISVESKLGSWTEFTVTLLVGSKHLKDEEIINEPVILTPLERGKNLSEKFVDDINLVDSSRQKVGQASQAPQNDNEINEDKNIILVVEDNRDVREFIKDSLGKEFQIEEASNGEQGVRKAEQIIPDLIISDIMMPKMDGNEFTRRIKNDERTSHIPVILLTAKSEQQSRLEGLETGADDYLTKPFDTKELLIRINNLIAIRQNLQKKFSGGRIIPRKDEKKLSRIDEKFLNKVFEISEKHLPEEEFSIEEFSNEAGMSRSQLHRKIKALTGKSPSLYLRSVRLTKAKKMIEEKAGNISEIAYTVGFSSPIYFSRCFKDEFGYPPSDLVK